MKKESENGETEITNEEIVETLLIISEASKALALEVMLIPDGKQSIGGGKNDKETSRT